MYVYQISQLKIYRYANGSDLILFHTNTISKSYKNEDHKCGKDRYRKHSERNKRQCVHNTHDTNSCNNNLERKKGKDKYTNIASTIQTTK